MMRGKQKEWEFGLHEFQGKKTVLADRILREDTFRRNPCGPSLLAVQWNYYEKHHTTGHSRVSIDGRVLRAVVWAADTRFQLAASQ
jgi:hypothetical protein